MSTTFATSSLVGDVRLRERHLHAVPVPPRETTLRLTRRGRVAVLLAAVLTLAVLVVALGSSTTATDEPGAPVATHTVAVEPGHTLWDIAADANPNGDIRQTVDDIMRLNSLTSAGALQSGSELAVPDYDG